MVSSISVASTAERAGRNLKRGEVLAEQMQPGLAKLAMEAGPGLRFAYGQRAQLHVDAGHGVGVG